MGITREQRIAATLGKNIYQEELTKVGNVSVPHETIQTLFEANAPTPGTVQAKASWGIPTVIENPIGTVFKVGSAIFGSRESQVDLVTDIMPIDIQTRVTEAPEYKVIYPTGKQKL